jgi:hypothetical protein
MTYSKNQPKSEKMRSKSGTIIVPWVDETSCDVEHS